MAIVFGAVKHKIDMLSPVSARACLHVRDLVREKSQIGAVVLAAGPSRRMGRPKQLLEVGGEPLLRRAASAAHDAGCRPVIVVTGANADATRRCLNGIDVCEIENREWETGMSSSIRVGLEKLLALDPEIAGTVLMLCDQPLVTCEIIVRLVRAHRETSATIVASNYGDGYGVPALFDRIHFAELRELQGSSGAKEIIRRHLSHVHLLPFPDGKIDIDTPEDFARLR